jgi:two-component system phosphate regulon sensor histidine kinase PhoR
MHRGRLFWVLFPSYVLITVASLVILGIYGAMSLRQFHLDQISEDLESRAILFSSEVRRSVSTGDHAKLDAIAKQLGDPSGTRITVIAPSGDVLADSEREPGTMDDHRHRPEISTAFDERRTGGSLRFSDTMAQYYKYVAVPVIEDDKVVAVVRASKPVTVIQTTRGALFRQLAVGGVVAVVLIVLVSWLIARNISRPLESMTAAARQFADGRLDHRLEPAGPAEFVDLATAMNQMAGQLNDRINTIVQDGNQRDAILGSMEEGVIALNETGRVIGVNHAAAAILEVAEEEAHGRLVHEIVRQRELLDFVDTALAAEQPDTCEFVLRGETEKHLHLHGSILYDVHGEAIGLLIVIHDVTILRRLERVRTEFITNVSHELRTPLSSIRASAETLQEGALSDPQNAGRFVDTIIRQSDQMVALIDDIFSLARIEKDAKVRSIEKQECRLREILETAADTCKHVAQEKQIGTDIACDDALSATLNPLLIRQAVVNLVDNAIKYSEAGSQINISAKTTDEGLTIEVTDEGCGIDRAHWPRLFERFYRVDKARSRELGGTGLGLAIVKHIALAHDGSVGVQSEVGRGSTFRICLPA